VGSRNYEKIPDIILAENNVVAIDIDKSNSGYLLLIKQQKLSEYKRIVMVR
jgi:hypothetical protein